MEAFMLLIGLVLLLVLLVKLNNQTNDLKSLRGTLIDIKKSVDNLSKCCATKLDIEEALQKRGNQEGRSPIIEPLDLPETTQQTPKSVRDREDETIFDAHVLTEAQQEAEDETENIQSETIDQEESIAELRPTYAAFSDTNSQSKSLSAEIVQPTSTSSQNGEENAKKSLVEVIFKENLLTKIGVVTLVLGIAFFVKYAIDQDWINEIGRVGIGLLTGGIIIGIAHKLKNQNQVFSSILAGGGISALYITITLAFREYEIFSQPVAFALLIGITIFSVIISLLYDRRELAIFSLLGGFASPLMISSGSGNYIVLFSYILILNTGMLIVAFRKKWHIIGIISYVLTLMFFWSWLGLSFNNEFGGATLFAALFFAQFYILSMIDHFNGENKLTIYQGAMILTNNLSLFLSCLTIFADYSYNVKGLITIIIAIVNAVIMIAMFRKKDVDRNLIYLIIGVVMTFVNLAIPIQMNGYVITMFWAVEMAVLLWLWQKSKIQIFRAGFMILIGLVVISYMMDIISNYSTDEMPMPIIINSIFITGLVVIASFFSTKLLMRKENRESKISDISPLSVDDCSRVINILFLCITFIAPFLELNYQIKHRLELEYNASLRCMILIAYTSVYVSILSFLNRKEIANKSNIFTLLSAFTVIYSLVYWWYVADLRFFTFSVPTYHKAYFLLHFVAIIPLTLVIITLVRNAKTAAGEKLNIFYWGLTVISTLLLGIEVENISVMLFANSANYASVLYDVRTFVFPVLWGLIAMGLMIWGLKSKEVILRKISLVFFGIIIVKFYAYDVWNMSQAGRIVSFILLGIIILLVSFLQQKIKILVQKDTLENE